MNDITRDDSRRSTSEHANSGRTDIQSLSTQRLSLSVANAPLLSQVVAPFEVNERKRALTSAVYYTECYLQGILPIDADSAAIDAHSLYNKWWVQAKKSNNNTNDIEDNDISSNNKRQKSSESSRIVVSKTNNNKNTQHGISDDVNVPTDDDDTVNNKTTSSLRSSSTRSNDATLRNDDHEYMPVLEVSLKARYSVSDILACKQAIIEDLNSTGGDTTTTNFLSCLHVLSTSYLSRGWDARWNTIGNNNTSTRIGIDGTWVTLSKPHFTECHDNSTDNGTCLYSLGRLSFDMFRPTGLKCSIQGVFNVINPRKSEIFTLVCPTKLQSELLNDKSSLSNTPAVRNYDIVVALTVASGQDTYGRQVTNNDKPETVVVKRPMKAFLTNHGFCIPDPKVPNRLTVWFTGGSLEVQDDENDLVEWNRLFDQGSAPSRNLREYAGFLAAKFLLGAEINANMSPTGQMTYTFKRPIGGHGEVFVDVLYSDDSLRIVKGHHGSIFVVRRVPDDFETTT